MDLCDARGVPLTGIAARAVQCALDESMSAVAHSLKAAVDEANARETELRERFVAILGHDLRQPLMTVRVGAAVLLRDDPAAHVRRVTERIEKAADRMGRMVGDMLDLARARGGGGITTTREAVDLGATLRHVLDELEVSHPTRTVDLVVAGDVRGEWDPARLAQAITNLIVNALAYSPEGSVVRVEMRGEGDRVALRVHHANRGGPIAPDVLARLFEPFRRSAASAGPREGGLGLGLYIAAAIVKSHGGSIDVQSAEAGTVVTVVLPRGPHPPVSSPTRPFAN